MDLLKKKQLLSHDGRLVDSENVLRDKGLVLYFFSAAWCTQCSPLLEMLQKIYDVIIDISDNKQSIELNFKYNC